jgi:hypothetical protein
MPREHNLLPAWLGALDTLDSEILRPALDAVQGGRWHSLEIQRSFGPAVEIHEHGAVFACGLDATLFCDQQQRNTGTASVPLRLHPAGPPDAWTVAAVESFAARRDA